MTRSGLLALLLAATLLAGTGAMAEPAVVRLATTTSTDNSGLLSFLLPEFERESGYAVHVIAVGTGKALRMARDGDVDLVLVHARAAEEQFLRDGHGIGRRDVMYNDFVLVGPRSDPAKAKQADKVLEAFHRVAGQRSLFLSRGDESGTHKKELSIWQGLGLKPAGEWYREAGQGMGRVLLMADQLDAYTLTDRGTWLAFRAKLRLELLFEGDPLLHNPYGIISVNPKKYPDVNYAGASALIEWITSPDAQRLIGQHRLNDERLFTPLSP